MHDVRENERGGMVSTRPRVCNANMTNESTIGREERREKERERSDDTISHCHRRN